MKQTVALLILSGKMVTSCCVGFKNCVAIDSEAMKESPNPGVPCSGSTIKSIFTSHNSMKEKLRNSENYAFTTPLWREGAEQNGRINRFKVETVETELFSEHPLLIIYMFLSMCQS